MEKLGYICKTRKKFKHLPKLYPFAGASVENNFIGTEVLLLESLKAIPRI